MRHLSAIPLVILALVACGTPEAAHEGEVQPVVVETPAEVKPTEAPVAPTETTAAPASGVTKDTLTASASADFPAFSNWSEVMAKVEPKLGKPMKVVGDTSVWYAKDGEQCTILTASKAGDIVGGAVVTTGPCPTP